MNSETAMSADRKIPGTQIEIPEILVLERFGYSVPGHPTTPMRKWRHDVLLSVAHEVGDEGLLPEYEFLEFCRVRDSAVETWRLPGCESGCKACAHLRPHRDDHELVDDLPVAWPDCDRDRWLLVPEGTTTWVSPGDPSKRNVEIVALPWTDFVHG